MTSTQYSKVPITEALIDFRVRPVCVENLTKFQSVLSTDYPLHKEIVEFETQVELHGDEQRSSFNQTLAGYQIADQKRTSVLKVEVNGFTFSQLGSYRGWASLRDEARSLWKIYCTVVEPKTVLRTSIRYINKIDLPLNDSENFTFQDYLRVLPEVPKELGPGLSNYVMRLELPQPDLESILTINETLLPEVSDDSVSVLLDDSLYKSKEFPAESEELWDLLEKFRVRKNEVFESCITDKTRELFRK